MLDCLPMGCLPSRSTTVSPADSSGSSSGKKTNGKVEASNSRYTKNGYQSNQQPYNDTRREIVDIGTSLDKDGDGKRSDMSNSMNEEQEDDMMSILMTGQDKRPEEGDKTVATSGKKHESQASNMKRHSGDTFDRGDNYSPTAPDDAVEREVSGDDLNPSQNDSKQRGDSFDDELNMDLLKQYIVVDYEITQLEDKDALRIYHEKIEQLEQLERELDMISSEAEEVAVRSEMDLSQIERFHSPIGGRAGHQSDSKVDVESNSMISGITGSVSPKSSIRAGMQSLGHSQHRHHQKLVKNSRNQVLAEGSRQTSTKNTSKIRNNHEQGVDSAQSNNQISSAIYSTVEEVFNRKIILEKERDKLKKEVELVIIECDKLQQKYKKRDEVLDKLFDGRTGNGLENHLEQQLNWLMEQKHYVDQVFYAWKRAETLTHQTCEQFASALDLLKRLPKLEDDDHRNELSKSIAHLLVKSRQDMEQAQRYNPNVDAPFFTDTETERFQKIIDTISRPQSISQSEYSQIATVIQFAYKRAVSIRLWLEQILQITIARDSFELAEEYKWIAIQLRKERITLINSKLQEPPYRAIAQSLREQLAHQSQQQQQQQQQQTTDVDKGANMINSSKSNKGEVNRDSGVESDDIDIEEEIYRLLEMNKSRLETAIAMQQTQLSTGNLSTGLNNGVPSTGSYNQQQRDEMMRQRVQRRLQGEQPLALSGPQLPMDVANVRDTMRSATLSAGTTTASTSTPSKLRIELDEATRQNLLKQVDQIHAKHRSKLESLRGNNKAKANDFISSRMQQARNPPPTTKNS